MPAVNLDLKERAMFKRVAIGIGILVVLGGGGVAFGAIPGADGVIKGCYDNSGSLKVIDSAATCNASSTAISWNQKGPKGDAGPNNLYWARLSADGKLLAKNAPVAYSANWGTGKYYLGFTGVDHTKCAITVTPKGNYTHYPVSAAVYGTYTAYTMVEVTQHRNNGWPLISEGVNAEISIVAACGGI
jgi:hypothetical protein